MDWAHFEPLAYGCKSEYAVAREDGLRLPMNGRLAAAEKPVTPVAALQQGLPVLMYVMENRCFEQRVVKVDNRLHFLYVLVGREGKEKQSMPIVVGLHQIWSVREGVNAMALCEYYDVKDENLTAESAVVVEIGQHRPEQDPPKEDLLIFCTPPKLRLRERILACSAGRGGGSLGDKGKQMVVPHMDGVRINDYKKVWQYGGGNSEAADVEVQFLTSSGHPGGKPVTVPMKSSANMAEIIIKKIHLQNNLTPVDTARIRFVILEAETMQKWAEHFNSACSGDFLSWMNSGSHCDSEIQREKADDAAVCVERGKECASRLLDGPQFNQQWQIPEDAERNYALYALTSAHTALRQLLELETMRSEMEEEEDKWMRRHDTQLEAMEAAKFAAPSRLISPVEEIRGPSPGSFKPMSASDAGSAGRRSIDSNRRSLEPGWDVNAGSSRAPSMVGASASRNGSRGLQQHEMVLPEASTVMHQNIESNLAPNVVSHRFGPNQADAMPANAGRLSIGSGGRMPASGTASGQAPSEASPRGRSAEDEHRRWMEISNGHLDDLGRAYEKEAMKKERPQQRGFFDSWLSSNMPGVAKLMKNELECGFGR